MFEDYSTRRKLLAGFVWAAAVAGGLCAPVLIGLKASELEAADPIYAAIDEHGEASRAYNAASKAAWARRRNGGDDLGYVSECDALVAAIERVIDTAPTTRDGLKALSDYLAEAENGGIGFRINQRLQAGGHVFEINPDPNLPIADRFFGSSVALFIAKRAAELYRG